MNYPNYVGVFSKALNLYIFTSEFKVRTQPVLNAVVTIKERIIRFLFFFFGHTSRHLQDLSSLTRDGTRAPCSGSAES